MSRVVYRGTAYDTVERRQAKAQQQQQTEQVTITYRGASYTKEVR